MAKIDVTARNKTLARIDTLIEETQKTGGRYYMGMSQIGDECNRKLFYSYRMAKGRKLDAKNIRAIEDGFRQEDIMAERLRLLPGVELFTLIDNKQIGYELLGGHFRGHLDGIIRGIEEAPKTWHVWENKAVNDTKFKALDKLIEEKGEKAALIEWDYVYYCQAQIYMHCAELTRHFLTVESPGGRHYTSCRTDYNKEHAALIIEKAKGIIFNDEIPAKLSEIREFYKCKWCDYSAICHDGGPADVNCGTCVHRHPVENAFHCGHHNKDIMDCSGCPSHEFLYCFVVDKVEKVRAAFRGTVEADGAKAWSKTFEV